MEIHTERRCVAGVRHVPRIGVKVFEKFHNIRGGVKSGRSDSKFCNCIGKGCCYKNRKVNNFTEKTKIYW